MDSDFGSNFWRGVMDAKRNGGEVGEALYKVISRATGKDRPHHEVNMVLVDLEGMVRSIRNGLDADRMGGSRGNANW